MRVVNDSKKFSNGRFDCGRNRFHCRNASNMRRKPSPLAPKIKLTPASGIKSAANRGPITPEGSICIPARVYAEPNSSAETISAMTEEWAGEPNAKPALQPAPQFPANADQV